MLISAQEWICNWNATHKLKCPHTQKFGFKTVISNVTNHVIHQCNKHINDIFNSNHSYLFSKLTYCRKIINPLTPKIWLTIIFSPLAATHFLVNKLWELGTRSRKQILPDKFKYSHYLFAELSMHGYYREKFHVNRFWEWKG